MEIAVILSAGLQDWIDFGVIIGILFLNAGVGWYQEKQAGDIVAKLKAGIAMKAFVVRDGKEQEIEARELVPGDIVCGLWRLAVLLLIGLVRFCSRKATLSRLMPRYEIPAPINADTNLAVSRL